ncbi:MAG: HEPN domain-containing protein [Defluviitaleaceae bacterium]|nr:HEPN domain-containing protein [Defluviitaleaceae bacterium]
MNSYKEIALQDMKVAELAHKNSLWNGTGNGCQQACEKYLKHYLEEKHLLAEELSRAHNLKKLMRAIPNYDTDLYNRLCIISGYYFEAGYPGENFIELNEQDAGQAIEITKSLMAYIDSLY